MGYCEDNKIYEEFVSRLSALGLPVFYGRQRIGSSEPWNYVVVSPTAYEFGQNRLSVTEHISVFVIHENYVDRSLVPLVVDTLCEIPGVRLGNSSAPIDHDTKQGTDIVVELVGIEFLYCEKR